MGFHGRACVGVAINWPSGESFSREILAGIDQAAAERDTDVLTFALRYARPINAARDPEGMLALEYLEKAPLDGLILISGQEWIPSKPDLIARIPTVSVVEKAPGIPSICIDNASGLNALLEHLFSVHKYRNPVFVSGPVFIQDAKDRLECFMAAAARYGIDEIDNRVYYGSFQRIDGQKAVEHFIDEKGMRPDVFICANDYMALGVFQSLGERGIRVPEDSAVTGFDDLPLFTYYEGPLSTVRQPVRELGRKAFTTLFDVMGKKEVPTSVQSLSSEAVFRSSCGCHQGAAHWVHESTPRLDNTPLSCVPKPGENKELSVREVERAADFLLQKEAAQHSANLDQDMYIDIALSAFCKEYIEDWRLAGHDYREKDMLREMGVGDFYCALYDGPNPGPEGAMRLYIAWEDGERKAIPEEGLPFCAQEILPLIFHPQKRRMLVVEGLADLTTRFGLFLISPNAHGANTNDKLSQRITEAMRAVRKAQEFKNLSDKYEAASAKLAELSLSDELTGLYNRRGFLTLASQQIAYSRRQKEAFTILYIDLDGLKYINDTWGHDAGDIAIRTMGSILKKSFRSSDIVARLGGDEFTVLAPNVPPGSLSTLHARVHSLMEEFNNAKNVPWRLSMSMGQSCAEVGDVRSIEEVMREADQRLYEEKKAKHSAWQIQPRDVKPH
jgi:diguanylate cyclase (GGDEF)-like protein